ncbi:hypothetical protein BH10ACI2_BH10ACI2_25470 [soil metagenome]
MKKAFYLSLIITVLSFTTIAQKLEKPTLTPSLPTAAQQKTLQEGVELHDAKKYAEAIAKYQSILVENHDCTGAMYEMANSLYAKGDKEKAVEMANLGSKYISDELPLFYVVMANALDDYGKPEAAINIYREGLRLLEGDKRFGQYRGSLYYNLGVTCIQQKKYDDARSALKSAVESDYNYPSPHYLLSYTFNGTRYKIPALLAASRFIALEFNTPRAQKAASIITDILKPAPKDPKTGNTVISLDFGAPADEGEFTGTNMLIGTLMTRLDDKDKKKTDNEMFVEGMGTVIALIAEDKKAASTFVGRNYIPFMVDMKKNGHVETFAYLTLYLSGKADAMTWLKNNDAKFGSFLAWAKAYRLP